MTLPSKKGGLGVASTWLCCVLDNENNENTVNKETSEPENHLTGTLWVSFRGREYPLRDTSQRLPRQQRKARPSTTSKDKCPKYLKSAEARDASAKRIF